MLVTGYWAEPFLDRTRTRVFTPTLDSMIDEDDPVRLVDEILAEIDWSNWEAEYNGHRGQPPIHPRYIAGAILYGMYRKIRSSRKLEEACHYSSIPFTWIEEGENGMAMGGDGFQFGKACADDGEAARRTHPIGLGKGRLVDRRELGNSIPLRTPTTRSATVAEMKLISPS